MRLLVLINSASHSVLFLQLLEVLGHVYLAAVGGAAFADGDRFGDDVARGVVREVHHLRAGVLVLAIVGQSDGENFAASATPFRTTPGYFMVRREPMLQSIHFTSAPSSAMPRLVTRLKTLFDQFCTVMYWILAFFRATSSTTALCRVAVSNFGRGAAFHVGDLGTFVGDDQGALKLAEVFRVDAEVGLQWLLELHALGHVDEAAAGESRAIQGGKLVVGCRDDLAEVGAEDFRIFSRPRWSRRKMTPSFSRSSFMRE